MTGVASASSVPSVVGFLHTSALHEATFANVVAELAPTARSTSLIAPELLSRAAAGDDVTAEVAAAVGALAASGAEVVVCTCSTLGPVIDRIAEDAEVSALRVDRPMAIEAVRRGARIAVVCTLPSTLAPTHDLLREAAAQAGARIEPIDLVIPEAAEAFAAGRAVECVGIVAAAVRETVAAQRPDVVLLAQASIAPAADALTDLDVAILTSPRSGVEAALNLLAGTPT